MGFTTPCFIRKNSKELRDKVYKLGGRRGLYLWDCGYNTLLIADYDHFTNLDDEHQIDKFLINEGFIDCGTNENLFISIAALRDDTDKDQWFWYNNKLFKCFGGGCTIQFNGDCSLRLEIPNEKTSYYDILKSSLKKATVEELIEHFKK